MSDRSTFGTKTGWGQSGQLTTGNQTKRVTMQADFNRGVGAFDFTAQFNLTPSSTGNAIVNAEALVRWRVEGQEVTRRLTIGAGASLTGVGQAVRVEMYDATPPQFWKSRRVPGTATLTPGSENVTFSVSVAGIVESGDVITFSSQPNVQYAVGESLGPDVTIVPAYSGPASTTARATVAFEAASDYGVSVQVSAGVRGSNAQPPLLQPYDGPPYIGQFDADNPSPGTGFLFVVPQGANLPVLIPEDAGVNQVFITVIANDNGKLVSQGQAIVQIENKLSTQRIWDASQVDNSWVPIPPGAEGLILTNRAPTGFGALVYSVAFGVDG